MYYFAYGSNMHPVSRNVKGNATSHTEAAALPGWRLTFNIEHPFPMEGCVANIERDKEREVHGVLCVCDEESLASLDKHEGVGVYYQHERVEVVTYSNQRIEATTYVGLPAVVGVAGKPSRRYRQILHDGAAAMGIQQAYLDALRQHPVHPPANFPEFTPPSDRAQLINRSKLPSHNRWAILCGHVFDMSNARANHVVLQQLMGGTDCTGLFLDFMDSSGGGARGSTVVLEDLNEDARRYLNNYLHAFSEEYDYIGRLIDDE